MYYPSMLLLLPAVLLALYANIKMRSTFRRFSEVPARSGITGAQAARIILQAGEAREVVIEAVPGRLSDHYDPRAKELRLSEPVYANSSLAALGVAAHEAGHALQHAGGYAALALRNAIVPTAAFGSQLAMPLFLVGFIFAARPLINVGIILYAGAVFVTVLTLPVELNASRRAIAYLRDTGAIAEAEVKPTRAVLSAAALTYVAAVAVALMQLLRLILLRGSRD
jgi:Zn-dependent membrane protease YugP